MKRFLLPFVMMLVFSAESIFTDLVHFPFVTDDQVLVPRFLMLVLIFMSAFINQKRAVIYGFIFGFLYDINYTSLLGVYMFGFAGLSYLASKAFKVLHTNAFVVILIAVLAVCLLEFYVFGIQSLIHRDIMTFNGFVLDRFIPTVLLNMISALILVLPFRLFFMSLKKELRDE
ncbi:rod shape-determining protein MreD [Bacillus mojavensis]|uniref:rod shape-determining protein MreD n=1 Tax=Bacillus mojavensis TaxID=72360 RepID=UPI002DBF932B|nr:rod shape-determining protein MreD [Bacillus mojavensis]MEC1684459.1 rod shape-determining protein MreD [Bacillus mojavensis]MEC1709735.1 rod shape-determining protein MreD [Bacillus mojavensis]